MFASIKPGGHFERKTRSARGKKPSKSPLLREKKKLQRARKSRETNASRPLRDDANAAKTSTENFSIAFKSFPSRFRASYDQKYASTINVHTRTACTNLPNFVHGVQTSLSSFPLPPPRPRPPPRPLPPPLSPPRPRRSPLSPPRPKPRENPPLSDSSAIVYVCFVFCLLVRVQKSEDEREKKKLRKEAKIHASRDTRHSFTHTHTQHVFFKKLHTQYKSTRMRVLVFVI